MTETFGIVAGSGTYPILMAHSARKAGVRKLVVAAFEGETDPQIADIADKTVWMRVGQLNKLCKTFSQEGVHEAAMAGGIALRNLFDLRPDFRCLKALARLKERNAHSLFGAVVGELAADNVTIVEATRFLDHLLPEPGHIAGPRLSARQRQDVEWGAVIAKQISAMNIGQTVVVRNGTVLAVEAYESTSDTILRGGRAGKEVAVAIKVCKPGHDFRFDVPVIGIKTMDVARESKLAVIAIEARKTLLLDKERMIEEANRHGITITAFETPA